MEFNKIREIFKDRVKFCRIFVFKQTDGIPVITIFVLFILSYISIFYSKQPLLEFFGFRQTQTALTSFWIIKDGWKLAYETPVAGYPWAIPFEFPFYQSIVALLSYIFKFPLDSLGRLISFIFIVACAWPVFKITKKLKIKTQVAWVFSALLWSSPLYLYWSRTFMIETMALFLTLCLIYYSIDLFESHPPWRSVWLFALFSTCALLQKVTTAAPIILIISLSLVYNHLFTKRFKFPTWRQIGLLTISFLLPLIILVIWTRYTDLIKLKNPLGQALTSNALTLWNYGSFHQRVDYNTLKTILWDRIILNNIAGFIGVVILVSSLVIVSINLKKIILLSLIMFIFPILIFTNLHFIHHYYQTSCAIYLIYALSVGVVYIFKKKLFNVPLSLIVTLILVSSNFYFFYNGYAKIIKNNINVSNSEILKIGEVIKKYTSEKDAIVVFGDDWSSEISYYSQRKSFTVPYWFENFNEVWINPDKFLGKMKVGAIIFRVSNIYGDKIKLKDILKRKDVNSDSCLFRINDFFLWIPGVKVIFIQGQEKPLLAMNLYAKVFDNLPIGYTKEICQNCDGSIDLINNKKPSEETFFNSEPLTVEGWIAYSLKDGLAPDEIFITIETKEKKIRYIETIRKTRTDVNDAFKKPNMGDVGFSTTFNTNELKGNYIIGVAMGYKGQLTRCNQLKENVKLQ